MSEAANLQEMERETRRIAGGLADRKGPLLPILNGVQERFGYIPKPAIPVIADALNLSRAEVHGVVSFYHLYREAPPGEHTLFVCCSEACRSVGAMRLVEHIKARLGVDFHETTADGRFSLEPIYCLGNCACAPAAMLDTTLHGRLSEDSIDRLLAE